MNPRSALAIAGMLAFMVVVLRMSGASWLEVAAALGLVGALTAAGVWAYKGLYDDWD